MALAAWLLFATGVYPLARAGQALRGSSLTHALAWAATAWLAWGAVLAAVTAESAGLVTVARYLALVLTCCAGVAVLGARRPGLVPWDFVVAGLLVTMLLFLAEGLAIGAPVQLGPVRLGFLIVTLAVVVLNYVPTRHLLAAVLLAGGCGLELWGLVSESRAGSTPLDPLIPLSLILATPWAALWSVRRTTSKEPADALWQQFRDRYGVVWSMRLREQFNRAAANAGLDVELGWSGLRSVAVEAPPDAAARLASLDILKALLKRFGPENSAPSERASAPPA